MKTIFKDKRISGMIAVLPQDEFSFDDETSDFSSVRARRLKSVMGYDKRRRAKKTSNVSDFCCYAMEHLLQRGYIRREDIGAVIVNTLTPDFYLPQVSSIIHGRFGLPDDVICMDIPQACTGFLLAAMNAFMLLDHMPGKKAVVFTSNVLSRQTGKEEHFTEPPFGGDATTATIIESAEEASDIFFDMHMDGKERHTLVMPTGAFRFPAENIEEWDIDEKGRVRIGEDLSYEPGSMNMDGSAVFNFSQREIPPLIDELLSFSGDSIENIDWFLFHQPNRFMLEKLAEKIGIPKDKMFMNTVERYGNSSGSTMIVTTIDNLRDGLLENKYRCCMAAFGGSMSWGAMTLDLGKLDFCEMLECEF